MMRFAIKYYKMLRNNGLKAKNIQSRICETTLLCNAIGSLHFDFDVYVCAEFRKALRFR